MNKPCRDLVIVDLEIGNIGSMVNMFKKLGVQGYVTNNPDEIAKAKRIVLPGVGAFDTASSAIDRLELRKALYHKAMIEKIPFLGVCLGMQLLLEKSEEGELQGLGFIKGKVKKMQPSARVKIPHMGWNKVEICQPLSELSKSITELTRFYFVHSFCAQVEKEENILFKSFHGVDFHSGIQNKNIVGFQFHPEKSHIHGMKLLESFLGIKC